jgi:hypothetical protein
VVLVSCLQQLPLWAVLRLLQAPLPLPLQVICISVTVPQYLGVLYKVKPTPYVERNWDIVVCVMTGLGTGRSGVQIHLGARNVFSKTFILSLRPTLPVQWVLGFFSGSNAAGAWWWPLTSI